MTFVDLIEDSLKDCQPGKRDTRITLRDVRALIRYISKVERALYEN